VANQPAAANDDEHIVESGDDDRLTEVDKYFSASFD